MLKNNMLGLGTAAIGRPQYINIRTDIYPSISLDSFKTKGIDVLNQAFDLGIRYFDTAPGYGLAEQLLIDWIQEKNVDNIEIATKWGYTYVANFDPAAQVHEIKEHTVSKLKEQWEQSKKLLPFLSTYQIHSATLETDVLDNIDILKQLMHLKEEYGLRMGITTTGSNQIEVLSKALDIEVNESLLFDVFQVTYNIFDQSLADITSRINSRNSRLVIKEALANGRVFENNKYPHYTKAYQILKELANKYRVGVDAVALRFCIDTLPVFKVLSGASNESHLIANLKALDFHLEMEEVEFLKTCIVEPENYWAERKKLAWN